MILVASTPEGIAVPEQELEQHLTRAMMSTRIPTTVLCLFVMNLGMAFGAGLYEHRIVVPEWLTAGEYGTGWNADAARRADTGRRFWAFVTTVPLTLLTFSNLVVGWRSAAPVRSWWIAAAVTAFAERIATFGYFIPTMIGLMDASGPPEAAARAAQWSALNYWRHGLVFAAWICSLRAFWLLARQGGTRR